MLLVGSDSTVVSTVQDVVRRWGGDFWIRDGVSWKQEIVQWKKNAGKVLHLTMYGESLPGIIDRLETDKLMVVVGAEKVPPEMYQMADYNVAVTHQPHSEIAALSILLDHLQRGQELVTDFQGITNYQKH
jgi:tRNA (cytidine56-2'-O)-methyltransferase